MLLSFGAVSQSCASSDLPDTWASEWTQKLRLSIAYRLPYVWGGESREEGGYDCSGLIYATAPLRWKLKTKAKRSQSGRMAAGLDGWRNRPVSVWDTRQMDLIFVPGHVAAIVIGGRTGLYQIIHSTKSKGPVEERMPDWLWRKKPQIKRLIIGDDHAVESRG